MPEGGPKIATEFPEGNRAELVLGSSSSQPLSKLVLEDLDKSISETDPVLANTAAQEDWLHHRAKLWIERRKGKTMALRSGWPLCYTDFKACPGSAANRSVRWALSKVPGGPGLNGFCGLPI